MKIKCPGCSHKFSPTEDEIYLDYDVDYDDDKRFVWERLPILKSVWENSDTPAKEESSKS